MPGGPVPVPLFGFTTWCLVTSPVPKPPLPTSRVESLCLIIQDPLHLAVTIRHETDGICQELAVNRWHPGSSAASIKHTSAPIPLAPLNCRDEW
ncbi:hypothetical protein AN958_02548 [Leucoagaricus sp. SymC.cos]|nr:hypothetical protein AN958_02548 [Leucoagaricus sp. SymC.cos]